MQSCTGCELTWELVDAPSYPLAGIVALAAAALASVTASLDPALADRVALGGTALLGLAMFALGVVRR
jgi:hypothetical protein